MDEFGILFDCDMEVLIQSAYLQIANTARILLLVCQGLAASAFFERQSLVFFSHFTHDNLLMRDL
jgi:hypothetical protein